MRLKYQIRIVRVVFQNTRSKWQMFYARRFSGSCKEMVSFSYLLLTFSFLLLLHPNTNAHTHTHTHMNHRSLAAFYAFVAFIYRRSQTPNTYPLLGRMQAAKIHILLQLKTRINIKEQPENYSANFHFFCLKKQCNCFRDFNDTAPHSVESTQYGLVFGMVRLAAVLSCLCRVAHVPQAQYYSGALQLQKFFLVFSRVG